MEQAMSNQKGGDCEANAGADCWGWHNGTVIIDVRSLAGRRTGKTDPSRK